MIHKCHEMHRWSHLYPTRRQPGIWKVQQKNYWPNQKKKPNSALLYFTWLWWNMAGAGCHPDCSQELWGWGWRLLGVLLGRRWFKGEITLDAAISFGSFNCVLRQEAEVLLLGKTSVPWSHWDAETRGKILPSFHPSFSPSFPSSLPPLEFSTIFILN